MSESCDGTYEKREVRVRKARKEHTCCACQTRILPGHFYANIFTLFEREVTVYKRCGACEKTHEHLVQLCRENTDPYDNMWPREDLGCGLDYEDEWGELPEEVEAFAFMSADEASALLAPVQP